MYFSGNNCQNDRSVSVGYSQRVNDTADIFRKIISILQMLHLCANCCGADVIHVREIKCPVFIMKH